ncbi:MAG: hypothetical protein AAF570_22780 [Bacteroidota bacterium]
MLLVLTREEHQVVPAGKAPLSSVKINEAGLAVAFPPVQEHWAWAHVQAMQDLDPGHTGDVNVATGKLDEEVEKDARQAVCRLLSSRRLTANQQYSAFVVPAFEVGRLTGLGLPDAGIPIQQSAFGSDHFPFYHSFDFATGASGDFESLARALEGQPIDSTVGRRDLDIRTPGLGLNGLADITPLEGALLPTDQSPTTPLSFDGADDFAAQLLPVLNRPADIQSTPPSDAPNSPQNDDAAAMDALFGTGNAQRDAEDPLITPPLYGQWYTDRDRIQTPLPADLKWFEQLNLEPGLRAAAGLGAEVVRKNQQAFLQAAWDQVGELIEANRKIRQMQLANAATEALLDKHIRPQSPDVLVAMTHRFHDRIGLNGRSLRHEIRASALPNAAPTNAFRRIVRPRGPIAKRFKTNSNHNLNYGNLTARLSNPQDLKVAPTWTISSAQNRVQATDLHRLAQTVIPISFTPQSVPYETSHWRSILTVLT